MRVLVTGATGFVGRHVCRRLALAGHQVIGMGRAAVNGQPAGEFIAADLAEPLGGALDSVRPDAVVHLAARAHVLNDTVPDPLAEFRRVNRDGTSRLAQWALAAGARRFVYVSSIGVNGNATAPGSPFTERSTPQPRDPYAISKHEAELFLRERLAGTPMELCIVRPPLVYGAGAPGNFGRLVRLVRTGLPLPFGAIHNRRSFIHVDNLADVLLRCVQSPAAAGELFLVSDGPVLSTAELLRLIAAALGRRSRLVPVPPALLRTVLGLAGKADLLDKLAVSLEVDDGHVRRILDWTPPVTPQEGWRRSVGAGAQ